MMAKKNHTMLFLDHHVNWTVLEIISSHFTQYNKIHSTYEEPLENA